MLVDGPRQELLTQGGRPSCIGVSERGPRQGHRGAARGMWPTGLAVLFGAFCRPGFLDKQPRFLEAVLEGAASPGTLRVAGQQGQMGLVGSALAGAA